MNSEFHHLTWLLFFALVGLIVFHVLYRHLRARERQMLKQLMAHLPDHFLKQGGNNRDNLIVSTKEVLEVGDKLSFGVAFFDSRSQKVTYNQTFARFTGIRDKGEGEIHILELPIFDQFMGQEAAGEQVLTLGDMKLKTLSFRDGEVQGMFLEDVGVKEREEREKAYFATTLWHEIKTPLTVMKGFVNVLLEEVKEPFLLKACRKIDKQVKRIENLVANLKTLSGRRKKQAGHFRGQDLSDMLKNIIDSWNEEREKRELDVSLDLSVKQDEEFTLRCTRGDFFIMVSNLLSNAIKFNRQKGKVWVKTEISSEGLTFEVQDTGSGVPPQFQHILYSPLGYTFMEDTGEKGMGLYLVKEAVERGGGRINFKTDEDGTSYRIFLPLSPSIDSQ